MGFLYNDLRRQNVYLRGVILGLVQGGKISQRLARDEGGGGVLVFAIAVGYDLGILNTGLTEIGRAVLLLVETSSR